MEFNKIKVAVSTQFAKMQKSQNQMFRVDVDKDELWSTYINSFPDGTNPIYRERTEHDCSCCRQFVRAVGDVVAVIDGRLVSVWTLDESGTGETAYDTVCNALSELVLSKPIVGPFVHYEPTAGVDRNFEQQSGIGALSGVKTWTHFHVNIDRKYVKRKDQIATWLSEQRSTHDVFLRSLCEITNEAVDTVLELIGQGSLYRGEEHRTTLLQFQGVKKHFNKLADDRARDIFVWTSEESGPVSRIRNTVIGSLLVDLSEGRDLEESVKSFESKVAPTNYKRPTALITKGMIEKAKEKIEELGLTSALGRRYARISDVTVNDLIYVDRRVRKSIAGGDVFDELAESASVSTKNLDRVEEVSIDKFISEIVPRAESIEVLFENQHQGNLVSLIAPVDPTARNLFKWGNNFSWSYVGELADSIKERVKKAGGNITGDLCCRLAWYNYDDLDLHMIEPSGYEIFYGNRYNTSRSGGRLDVDMNVTPTTREPVENIFYLESRKIYEGVYHLFVHQYRARDSADTGFECEIDYLGATHRFVYSKPVKQDQRVTIAKFNYTHKGGIEIVESLPSTQATRTVWGLPTQTFHRVSSIMLSPNCWGEWCIGNKHFMFMLEGCKNDGTARGFFNEFLSEALTPHRKVFEVVGSKMKPEDSGESGEQLSGLGFSSTQRNSLVCRVKGSFTRTIKVMF